MSNYGAGRRFEWRVRDYLKKSFPGAVVFRSAGSKGPADLILLSRQTGVIFVQCKNRKPTRAENEALKTFADEFRVSAWMVWRGEKGRIQTVGVRYHAP